MNISTQPRTSQQGWDFIDKIYCISLEHRNDRRQQAQAEFDRVGLGQRVEFLISQKHPTNAELGNFLAQMNGLRTGLETGADRIAIFEDDILFDQFTPQKLHDAVDFMQTDINWHILFLGAFVKTSTRTKYPSILNVRFRCTTHAYVITRNFARQLVETPWPGRCLDDLLKSLNDKQMYAVYPSFAFQSNSPTDNDKQIAIDRFRRSLGGVRRLQKWNEFSSLHLVELIVIHTGAVLLIALLLFIHFHHP